MWFLFQYIYTQLCFYRMINLIGTYECKADAKGRVLLPIALKKQLASSMSDGFVIKRSVFNTCLELHPMSEWNVLMGEVNKLNRFVKRIMTSSGYLRQVLNKWRLMGIVAYNCQKI